MGYVPPQGALSWEKIKFKLEEEGSLNKKYDADKDGVVDLSHDFERSYQVGDTVIAEDTTEESREADGYALIKEITLDIGYLVPTPLTLRIVFTLRSNLDGKRSYGRIYRNGVAVGVERKTTSSSYTTYSEDIEGWNDGDAVQLYIRNDTIDGIAYTNLLSVRGDLHPRIDGWYIKGEITA